MENQNPKILKKEFKTYWSQEMVHAATHKMPLSQQRFFEEPVHDRGTQAVIPDNIPFTELIGFCGYRTKVTIEIIPHD